MNNSPSWLTGILAKRHPDSIYILVDLVQAGLKKGECSANDITPRAWEQVNIIGATSKLLPQFGFVHTERWTATKGKQKHGRYVRVWELADRGKAERFLIELRALLFKQVRDYRPQQTDLWLGVR